MSELDAILNPILQKAHDLVANACFEEMDALFRKERESEPIASNAQDALLLYVSQIELLLENNKPDMVLPVIREIRKHLLQDPQAALSTALFEDFCDLAKSVATELHKERLLDDAIEAYSEAIEAQELLRTRLAPSHAWTPVQRDLLADDYLVRGNARLERGRPDKAIGDFQSAVTLREEICRGMTAAEWSPRLRNDLASAYSRLGRAYFERKKNEDALSNITKAITLSKEALELSDGQDSSFRNDLAMNYLNRGRALERGRRLPEALDDYRAAIKVIDAGCETADPGARESRARASMHLGNGLLNSQKPEDALDAFKPAIQFLEAEREKREGEGRCCHPASRIELAGGYLNLGNAYQALEQGKSALEEYNKAIGIFEALPDGIFPEADETRLNLYANMAGLLDELPDAHTFAEEKSRRMADLLELTLPGAEAWERGKELRRHFARFHAQWLRHCITTEKTSLIPGILAVLQGRDLFAGLLDRLDQSAQGIPEPVRKFQELREQLRQSYREIQSEIRRGQRFDVVGASQIASPGLSIPTEPPGHLQKLERKHNGLLTILPHWRKQAAKERGYEDLNPARRIKTRALQKSLGQGEALLLLVDFPELQLTGCLVIRRNGRPQWHEIPGAAVFAMAVAWAGQELLGSGRGYRGGPSATAVPSSPAPDEQPIDIDSFLAQFESWHADKQQHPRPVIEPTMAWSQFADWQKANVWAPLSNALTGIECVHCITHGRLHLLPLEAGAPERLSLSRYPGLVFFAERRGLIGGAPQVQDPPPVALALDAHPGDDENRSIPLVNAEAAALRALYPTDKKVAYPGGFPNAEQRASLVHLACHGGRDPKRPGAPALHLRPSEYLGETHLLNCGQVFQDAYINACIAAWTVEDDDGAPTGLISSLMRRGAQQVIGALVSISDFWSFVLAILAHQAMVRDGLALGAGLSEGKRRLREGEWYEDTQALLESGIKTIGQAEPVETPLDDFLPEAQKRHNLIKRRGQLEYGRSEAGQQTARGCLSAKVLDDEFKRWDRRERDALQERLGKLAGTDWDEALVRDWTRAERIPPQPDLGALLYGMVVFGEPPDAGPPAGEASPR